MSAATIDKQISSYILQLNTVQKKAILGIVKAFVAAEQNTSFDEEMERRFADLESGKVKGYTLEETEARAKKAYKASKK